LHCLRVIVQVVEVQAECSRILHQRLVIAVSISACWCYVIEVATLILALTVFLRQTAQLLSLANQTDIAVRIRPQLEPLHSDVQPHPEQANRL
jgi:hypothetical protein